MAEYMDYNDYDDGPKTKKAKIKSIIVVSLSVAWLLALVVWTVVGTVTRETFRSHFDTVKSGRISIGQNKGGDNEFYSLYLDLQKGDINSKDLKLYYPIVNELVKTPPKQYPSNNEPRSLDAGRYLTVYLPYVIEGNKEADTSIRLLEGTIGFDVLLLPYESDKYGSITLTEPIRYSFTYDCENMTAKLSDYSSDRFRLNFYKLSVKFDREISDISYNAVLNYPLIKSESENDKIQKKITFGKANYKTTAGGAVSDSIVSAEFSGESADTLIIEYDDLIYRKLGQITVKVDPKEVKNFRILIN